MKIMRTKHIFLYILALVLMACGRAPQTRQAPVYEAISWRGITPGLTTEEQVLSILGNPSEIYDSDGEYYYNYRLEGLNLFHYHRIYFSHRLFQPRVVSWLDVETGVNTSNPYIIATAMDEYGGIVDTAAKRVFIDLEHIELVYVWANRGVALLGLDASWMNLEMPIETSRRCTTDIFEYTTQVPQRYIVNDAFGKFNDSSPCDVVVRMVIFEPTDFWEFWDANGYKISYIDGPLDEYVHEEK